MKFKKSISILVLAIIVLSLIASATAVLSNAGLGEYEFKSLKGEIVKIYGKGLYQYDSVSMAAQALAQDYVTLFLGIPLLGISLYLFRKGSFKGKLLLTGTLGYFLYTYASYSFLSMYNSLFLVDVVLMSASFFAFTLMMMSFDMSNLSSCFKAKLPVKFVGGFLIFLATMIGLMWIGRIVPPLMNGTIPVILEHYTTLVIQALDLGFVVPVAILAGVMVIKKKPFGYLLASIVIVKGITLMTALSAMIIGQLIVGVKLGIVEIAMFPLFNLITIYCLVLIFKNVDEKAYKR